MTGTRTYGDYGITGIDISGSDQQRTTCPQCSHERKKSNEKCLSVDVNNGRWMCHHCGWYGTLNKGKVEIPTYKEIKMPKLGNSEYLETFFKPRGIGNHTLEKNGVHIAITTFSQDGKKRQAIAFPYYFGSKVVNIKFRSSAKDFKMVSGAPLVFYRLNEIVLEDEVIITEGEIDALSYVEVGYDNVISVPDGAPSPTSNPKKLQMRYLNDAHDVMSDKKRFYLSLDSDGPGRALRDELARRLGKARCYVVKYPSDCKDANEVLVKHGRDVLVGCIEDAAPYPIDGAVSLGDIEDSLDDIYEKGFPSGVLSGFSKSFDKLIRLPPKMLTVVTGIPNHGKSPFVDQLSLSLAKTHGWKTAFFSPENGSVEIHVSRLIRQYVKKNIFGSHRMTRAEYEEAKRFIKEHMFFVFPRDMDFSADNVLDLFAYFVAKEGVKNVVIDPWNTIEHQSKTTESITQYVGRMLNRFKYFAREYGVHFIVVAHPYKLYKEKGSDLYEVPTMYSISDSANWYNVPDLGMTVYRRFDLDTIEESGVPASTSEIHIQKVKFDFLGSLGMVEYNFDVPSQTFYE